MKRICVFSGSSDGTEPTIVAAAEDLGDLLAGEGIELVYGGASVGLMGRIADRVLAGGGRVTGVIPAGLFTKEVGHPGLTELIEVGSMHERKQHMYDLSDAFVALPGGLGTLEELAEIATWGQLGLHRKPIAVLDVGGFWAPLLEWLDTSVDAGLLRPQNRALIRRAAGVADVMEVLAEPMPPRTTEKWISLDET
jgi:uncharacterized protein (TIGR00730 family)